jgi:hypothetical protein
MPREDRGEDLMWWETDLHCPDSDDEEALCQSCNWGWCPAQTARIMWEMLEEKLEEEYQKALAAFDA